MFFITDCYRQEKKNAFVFNLYRKKILSDIQSCFSSLDPASARIVSLLIYFKDLHDTKKIYRPALTNICFKINYFILVLLLIITLYLYYYPVLCVF